MIIIIRMDDKLRILWVSLEHLVPITRVKIAFEHYRIQEIRLLQALIEAKWEVGVPTDMADAFRGAASEYTVLATPRAAKEKNLDMQIHHEAPLTRVNAVERILIFPEKYFVDAHKQWADQRPVRVSFAGVATRKRLSAVSKLIQGLGGRGFTARCLLPFLLKISAISKKPKGISLINQLLRSLFSNDEIEFSDRGRVVALKTHDPKYLDSLMRAAYIFCPNGDFIWTYRFFEATAFGCTPVVEDTCNHYEDYKFLRIGDSLERLPLGMLEKNYALTFKKITCRRELEALH